MIDNHNSLHMHPISMEETWMTTRWPNRVFCFSLAVSVVNVQNASVYFYLYPKIDALMAWKHIARDLIHNNYLKMEQSPSRKHSRQSQHVHHLITLPTHTKILMDNSLLARTNIRHGCAPAKLPVLGHIVHALLDSFYALNVTQLSDLRKQWFYLLIHNSVLF